MTRARRAQEGASRGKMASMERATPPQSSVLTDRLRGASAPGLYASSTFRALPSMYAARAFSLARSSGRREGDGRGRIGGACQRPSSQGVCPGPLSTGVCHDENRADAAPPKEDQIGFREQRPPAMSARRASFETQGGPRHNYLAGRCVGRPGVYEPSFAAKPLPSVRYRCQRRWSM